MSTAEKYLQLLKTLRKETYGQEPGERGNRVFMGPPARRIPLMDYPVIDISIPVVDQTNGRKKVIIKNDALINLRVVLCDL